MNELTFACGDGASLSVGTLLGNMEGGSFTGNFEGKVNYWGKCRRKLWKQVSLSVGAQLGNLGGVCLLGILRDSGRGLQKWSISLCGSSVRGTWRGGSFAGDLEGFGEDGSEDGHLTLCGPPWGAW